MPVTKHHIFIDANIYLRFHKLSDSDVKELNQLVTLVKSGEVRLYLTEQVRDEYNRNREEAIVESITGIGEKALKQGFPRMLRDHTDFPDLRKAAKAYEDRRQQMLGEITEAAKNKELAADKLIEELFELADYVPLTDKLWETARRRHELRNPPGKGKSYGDAVHWVSLLDSVPDRQDLIIVSDDGDFKSLLDPTQISDFLREEWREKKSATATLYPTLPDMFRVHYPDMHLLEAMEKEMTRRALAVRSLVGSENFLQTHAAIQLISRFTDFLPQEVDALMTAAVSNTQIRWILNDDDVYRFYTLLARRYEGLLDAGLLADFWSEIEDDGVDDNQDEDYFD